jgi:predicted PurR-regulated permease PerM
MIVAALIVSVTIAVSTWRIIMAIITTFDQLRDAINAATNKIAARLDAFTTGIGTLTPAQQAEASAMVESLQALGADASDPVPEPVAPTE